MNIPSGYHSSIYLILQAEMLEFCNVEFNFQRSLTEVDSKNCLFLEGLNLTDLENSHFASSGVKTPT